jgi:hypothetical protein
MYAVPGFLQGLYFEGVIPPFVRQLAPDTVPTVFGGGATYTDVGFGLSFYDDNVKIQGQYGIMTQDLREALGGTGPMRFGGNVFGVKILANVYSLPFGSFAGPDFDWLHASLSFGANFSYFEIAQSGEPTWVSALLAQLEFPKVKIPKKEFLRTFSLFTEFQLWFMSTDVNAGANNIPVVVPHVVTGLRIYIF